MAWQGGTRIALTQFVQEHIGQTEGGKAINDKARTEEGTAAGCGGNYLGSRRDKCKGRERERERERERRREGERERERMCVCVINVR